MDNNDIDGADGDVIPMCLAFFAANHVKNRKLRERVRRLVNMSTLHP